ncbi:MAG: ABC transporter ATP-binding protein [Verrucomicrobiota bacterium]
MRTLCGEVSEAKLFEALLRADATVERVSADPVTGRVLIVFKQSRDTEEVAEYIQSSLVRVAAMPESERIKLIGRTRQSPVGVFRLLGEIPGIKILLVLKAVAFSVTFNALNILPPLIFAAIAYLGMNGTFAIMESMGVNSLTMQFILVAIGGLIVYSIRTYFSFSTRDAWRELGQTVQHSLRTKIFKKVQFLELPYVADRTHSGIRDVVSEDTAAVEAFYEKGLEDIIRKVVTLIFVQQVYLLLSPLVAIIVFLIIFAFWVSWSVFHRNAAIPYKAAVEADADLNEHISKNIAGIETVRSYVAEKFEIERMQDASLRALAAGKQATLITWLYSHLVDLCLFVCFLLILTVSGIMLANGLIDIGAFIILVFLIPRVGVIFDNIEETLDLYQRANAASRRILDLLAIQPSSQNRVEQSLETADIRGHLDFRSITFSYTGRSPVIAETSFEIPAGSSCAFVGSTGSGKSTLARLLMRFYDLNQGQICLDGHDISELNVQFLRSQIGYVSQDTYLFNGKLIDNIRFGRPDATLEEVVTVTKMVGIYEFIEKLENGFDTIVGERGQFLSGGQRQLISISRALIKNPKIFIFDEATSALDNETEAMIHNAISKVMQDRTTIVIAHRLSTITNVDKIHVLSEAGIHESGSHEQLVKDDGIYAALWKLQARGLG